MQTVANWGMKVTERQKLNVFEMKCLRSLTAVSRLDRVRNEVESENRCEERIGSQSRYECFDMVWSCGEDG